MKKIGISIDKERPNIISSEDKNTAKNESDKIVAVDYVQKLAGSKDETTLFFDKVYRLTIGSFCFLGVAIVIFVVGSYSLYQGVFVSYCGQAKTRKTRIFIKYYKVSFSCSLRSVFSPKFIDSTGPPP